MQWKARVTGSIHNEIYRGLIDCLSEARKNAGVTQQELASRLGKPQSFVAKIEGYERRLDVLEFLEIANAVGIDPARLIRLTDKKLK